MSQLADITYSREATIAAVTDYYEFLTKLYLDSSRVIYPPAGGWPSIVNARPKQLAALGKSDEVLGLLAHLPYIRCPDNWFDDVEAAPSCVFAEWQDLVSGIADSAEVLRACSEGPVLCELALPHVIGLTFGDRNNPKIVLDTKVGVIHWADCPFDDLGMIDFYDVQEDDEEEHNNDEEDLEDFQELDLSDDEDLSGDEDCDCVDSGEVHWRDIATTKEELLWRQEVTSWAIPDFFQAMKDQFQKLEWIPISSQVLVAASTGRENREMDAMARILRDIYHQHGWPDLVKYRKSECLEAVQRVVKEHYPIYAELQSR
ncbi:hypothetical protein GE09DRAFT_696008 [Coniochaeta sp. 2T2.1]|nr:hypothetical protein GE09DRAFT_696008 [Coniochaeta sp. 2T2.1]